MGDVCVDRTNLSTKEEKPSSARCSSPIGINGLSPNEDVVYKREETRKFFSPIGSPMVETSSALEKSVSVSHSLPIPTPTSQSTSHNSRSFSISSRQQTTSNQTISSPIHQQTKKQPTPHPIVGLFSNTSDRTSQFIKSFSPATNNDNQTEELSDLLSGGALSLLADDEESWEHEDVNDTLLPLSPHSQLHPLPSQSQHSTSSRISWNQQHQPPPPPPPPPLSSLSSVSALATTSSPSRSRQTGGLSSHHHDPLLRSYTTLYSHHVGFSSSVRSTLPLRSSTSAPEPYEHESWLLNEVPPHTLWSTPLMMSGEDQSVNSSANNVWNESQLLPLSSATTNTASPMTSPTRLTQQQPTEYSDTEHEISESLVPAAPATSPFVASMSSSSEPDDWISAMGGMEIESDSPRVLRGHYPPPSQASHSHLLQQQQQRPSSHNTYPSLFFASSTNGGGGGGGYSLSQVSLARSQSPHQRRSSSHNLDPNTLLPTSTLPVVNSNNKNHTPTTNGLQLPQKSPSLSSLSSAFSSAPHTSPFAMPRLSTSTLSAYSLKTSPLAHPEAWTVAQCGYRSGWMGPATGPASRSILLLNLPHTTAQLPLVPLTTPTVSVSASTSTSTNTSTNPTTTSTAAAAATVSSSAPSTSLSSSLSVFSLPFMEQLLSLLISFGPIRSLQMCAPPSTKAPQTIDTNNVFLIVSYYDIRHAQNAVLYMHSLVFHGRKLDVQYFFPKDYISARDQNQGTLVIFNLDSGTTNDELKAIFGVYGEIKEIRESPNKKHKFVEFYDVRDAERALKHLNKTEVRGKKIKIEPSRPGGPRKNMIHHLSLDTDYYSTTIVPLNAATSSSSSSNLSALSPPPPPSATVSSSSSTHFVNNTGVNEVLSLPSSTLFNATIPASESHPVTVESSTASLSSHSSLPTTISLLGATPPRHSAAKISTPSVYTKETTPLVSSPLDSPLSPVSPPAAPIFSTSSSSLSGTNSISVMMNNNNNNNNNNNHHHPSPVTTPRVATTTTPPNMSLPPSSSSSPQSPSVLPLLSSSSSAASSVFSASTVSNTPPSTTSLNVSSLGTSDVVASESAVGGATTTVSSSTPSTPSSSGANSPTITTPTQPLSRRRRTHSGRRDTPEDMAKYELHLHKVRSGQDLRTTLMIKNIPNKYDQEMLLTTIDRKYKGTYDFFYLPIDFKNKCNVGYAFINFMDPHTIAPFYEDFNNKKWEKFNSEKVCKITYARIQGKAALIDHFRNSSLMYEDAKCRPLIFTTYSDGTRSTAIAETLPLPSPSVTASFVNTTTTLNNNNNNNNNNNSASSNSTSSQSQPLTNESKS